MNMIQTFTNAIENNQSFKGLKALDVEQRNVQFWMRKQIREGNPLKMYNNESTKIDKNMFGIYLLPDDNCNSKFQIWDLGVIVKIFVYDEDRGCWIEISYHVNDKYFFDCTTCTPPRNC